MKLYMPLILSILLTQTTGLNLFACDKDARRVELIQQTKIDASGEKRVDTAAFVEWAFQEHNPNGLLSKPSVELHPLTESLQLHPEVGSHFVRYKHNALDRSQLDATIVARIGKLGSHGTSMLNTFASSGAAKHSTKPICLGICATKSRSPFADYQKGETFGARNRASLQQSMELLIEQGVKIFNFSVAIKDANFWPDFHKFVHRHPDVLFVVAAGNEGKALENRDQMIWPKSALHHNLPNIVAVGTVTSKENGQSLSGRRDQPYTQFNNHSPLIQVASASHHLTSPSAAEFTRLLALVQNRFLAQGREFNSQDVLRYTLKSMGRKWTKSQSGSSEMHIFTRETYKQIAKELE